ncbi:MAG TPA: hypothetical protein ENI23_11275 [bacterium]|nr:hypothetical protein [bacterium]
MYYDFILPSKGRLSGVPEILRFSKLKVEHHKQLITSGIQQFDSVFQSVLSNMLDPGCGFNIELLSEQDKFYILMQMRSTSIGNIYTVKIPKCQICEKSFDHEVDLNALEIEFLKEDYVDGLRIKIRDDELILKIPRWPDIQEVSLLFNEDIDSKYTSKELTNPEFEYGPEDAFLRYKFNMYACAKFADRDSTLKERYIYFGSTWNIDDEDILLSWLEEYYPFGVNRSIKIEHDDDPCKKLAKKEGVETIQEFELPFQPSFFLSEAKYRRSFRDAVVAQSHDGGGDGVHGDGNPPGT